MTVGDLINEWVLLNNSGNIQITLKDYIRFYGTYEDNINFNLIKKELGVY